METLTKPIPGRWYKGNRNRTAHYYRPGEGLAVCGTYAHTHGGNMQAAEAATSAPKCQKCLSVLGF